MAALIAVLIGTTWLGWHRADHWKAETERFAASVAAARKTATTAQVAVNHAPAVKSGQIAENSNAQAPAYYAAVHAAADAHRVRGAAGPARAADLSGADRAEPGVHGPDAAADMVSRPRIEDDQILAAAARGAEMHQEALDLISEGAAVAAAPGAETPPATARP
jgi:hypothetical protein